MDDATLRAAVRADADGVLRLYHACIGVGDCVWQTEYPAMEEIEADLRDGYLYLWEADGQLAGAVSLMADDDVEHLGLPFASFGKPCVLCRLCVSPALQNGGRGAKLLAAAERKAADMGYGAMHLLVDLRQRAARRLYDRAGYRAVGSAAMYGHEFTAMEKQL